MTDCKLIVAPLPYTTLVTQGEKLSLHIPLPSCTCLCYQDLVGGGEVRDKENTIRRLRSQLYKRRPGRHTVCCVLKREHLLFKAVEENELPTTTREPRDPLGSRVQLDERKIPLISISTYI